MATVTVPMPPWMRRVQQSFYWQNIFLPTAVGFGGSLIIQGCLGQLDNIQKSCVVAAFHSTVLTWITAWVKGHSTGSTSFAADGTDIAAAPKLKELADNVIAIKAQAADPTIPQVTQADANAAAVKLNDATTNVAMANSMVKDALANEAK